MIPRQPSINFAVKKLKPNSSTHAHQTFTEKHEEDESCPDTENCEKIKGSWWGGREVELERELGEMKALDHVKLADWTFKTQIFKNEEYLQSKLKELGMPVPLVMKSLNLRGWTRLRVKCYQDAVKGCRSDLEFIHEETFHEESKTFE